eukprot:gene29853-33680_t
MLASHNFATKTETKSEEKYPTEEGKDSSTSDSEKKKKKPFNVKESYLCARPSTAPIPEAGGNEAMIKQLDEMKGIYEMQGDEWRTLGYKKAVAQLKRMPTITSLDQLDGVKGIGKRLREKIGEILESGELKKLKYCQEDPQTQAMLEISKVWGIGDRTAEKLVHMGYHSVKDLRERGRHLLTAQQLIGLKHYEELLKKIPRAEVERIHAA